MSKDSLYIRLTFFALLFILLASKAVLLFHTPYFDDPESYVHLQEIKSLSFGSLGPDLQVTADIPPSRDLLFYYYLLSFGYSLFPSLVTLKIFELLFLGLVFYIVFRLAKNLTDNDYAALFSTLVLGTMPLVFDWPNSRLSPEMFLILLVLLSIYILLKSSILFESFDKKDSLKRTLSFFPFLRNKSNIRKYYIFLLGGVTLVLSLFGSYALFFGVHLLLFLILSYFENYSDKAYFREFTTFFILLVFSFFLFLNKASLAELGLNFLFRNNFSNTNLYGTYSFSYITLFLKIGVGSILCGVYSIYFFSNNKKLKEYKKIIFYSCGVFVAVSAFFLKVGHFRFVLYFSGIFLTLLLTAYVARWITHASKYYSISLSEKTYWFLFFGLVLIGILSLNYSLSFSNSSFEVESRFSVTEPFVDSLSFLSSKQNATLIITPYFYGDAIAFFSNNYFLLGNNFMKTKNPSLVIENLNIIYKNINSISVQKVIDDYIIKAEASSGVLFETVYIYFDSSISHYYSISQPGFSYDESCFVPFYTNSSFESKINTSSKQKVDLKNTSYKNSIIIYEYQCTKELKSKLYEENLEDSTSKVDLKNIPLKNTELLNISKEIRS